MISLQRLTGVLATDQRLQRRATLIHVNIAVNLLVIYNLVIVDSPHELVPLRSCAVSQSSDGFKAQLQRRPVHSRLWSLLSKAFCHAETQDSHSDCISS
jgi:hypothetical protein